MFFGDEEIEVVEINAEQTVKLIKFVSHVYGETKETNTTDVGKNLQEGNWMALLNILSSHHLYDLTAILLELPKTKVRKSWTLSKFFELIGEVAEKNDLPSLLKNLQRVAVSFKNSTLPSI